MTYVHEPQAFRVIPPLETLLAKSSREQLIVLIGEMIKREPDLLSVVELAAAATQPGDKAQAGKSRDVSAYRRQARRVMRSESPHRIESELRALRAAAGLSRGPVGRSLSNLDQVSRKAGTWEHLYPDVAHALSHPARAAR